MPSYITVIAFVALLFTAMILRLATSRGFSNKLTGWLVVIAALGGFAFYGYSYAQNQSTNLFLAVIQALLAVCDMFTGSVDEAALAAELRNDPIALTFFWLLHLMAFYATASATVSVIGAEALRKLRVWFVRRGNLCIIYGARKETVEFGRSLANNSKSSIVYVDPTPEEAANAAIIKNGFVLRSDSNAVRADERFAKSIGIRKGTRKITLYAISRDGSQNLAYAKAFLDTLRCRKINVEQTRLVITGCHEYIAAELQSLGDTYGYGSVTAFQESELVARVLVQKHPPCNTISFDKDGKAMEDFHALVIGFGQVGQSVLHQLIINGQFYGSNFRCDVFAPDCYKVHGFLPAQVIEQYNIRLHTCDGRSTEMFQFLNENIHSLKYVALCTGSERVNAEINSEIALFCRNRAIPIPIFQCSRERIIKTQLNTNVSDDLASYLYGSAWFDPNDLDANTLHVEEISLFDPELMRYERLDAIAMEINKYYFRDNEKTAQDLWKVLPYFMRISNRAAADYIPALLKAADTCEADVINNGWSPSPELLENLGRSEHMRWCAFHFCMGYTTMTENEFQQRADKYRMDGHIRISKNSIDKTHACLIPWEELDALSAKENAITGKNVDYKENDIRNIQVIRHALTVSRNVSS